MRAPEFWDHDGWRARLLAPLAALYAAAGRRRRRTVTPAVAGVPVICVGNIVAGGAGKTPLCLALARLLAERGHSPHFLTRGHGGSEIGPRAVDPIRHDAARVGDEALLLVRQAPTWVARWRPDGAAAAVALGADCLVMDDGFQNPSLRQDLALVVVDGTQGFGNGRVIPAGPCREPVAESLARAGAVVVMGQDSWGVARAVPAGLPVLRAHLAPAPGGPIWAGTPVLAFAGIGRPGKFFASLGQCGAQLVETHAFADHHPFSRREVETLLARARSRGARAVTTAKDLMRVPEDLRGQLAVLEVELVWDDNTALAPLLEALPWR